MEIKFIADNNVGKLARWLRIIGYDTALFKEKNDLRMIQIALHENRVILTRDSQLLKRRIIASGRLRAVFVMQNDPKAQLKGIVEKLSLSYSFSPFSLCLECNGRLTAREKEEVRNLVPPHVFETQNQFMQCPVCYRVYWQGTHWQAMTRELENLQRE